MDCRIATKLTKLNELDSEQLLSRLHWLIKNDQALEVAMLLHISEVDRRKLFLKPGYSSMYRFCVEHLHLSEATAYRRIHVARAARKFPHLLAKIETGELHLTGAALLVPHLNRDNSRGLIEAAVHKSKREIEKILAQRFPAPDVPATIRQLPTSDVAHCLVSKTPAAHGAQTSEPADGLALKCGAAANNHTVAMPLPRPRPVTPLSTERYKIQFTADEKFVQNLEKAKNLLGPAVPEGDLAAVFERALALLVEDIEKRKHGKTKNPRSIPADKTEATRAKSTGSKTKPKRYIPREVQRRVYERDGCQCAYVSPEGKRCQEAWGLEYHHRTPFAHGGEATEANLELRCRSHNGLAAQEDFGAEEIRRALQRRKNQVAISFPEAMGKEGRVKTEVREGRPSYLHLRAAKEPSLHRRKSQTQRSGAVLTPP